MIKARLVRFKGIRDPMVVLDADYARLKNQEPDVASVTEGLFAEENGQYYQVNSVSYELWTGVDETLFEQKIASLTADQKAFFFPNFKTRAEILADTAKK